MMIIHKAWCTINGMGRLIEHQSVSLSNRVYKQIGKQVNKQKNTQTEIQKYQKMVHNQMVELIEHHGMVVKHQNRADNKNFLAIIRIFGNAFEFE